MFFQRRSDTARRLPVDTLLTFSFLCFKLSEQNDLLRFKFTVRSERHTRVSGRSSLVSMANENVESVDEAKV